MTSSFFSDNNDNTILHNSLVQSHINNKTNTPRGEGSDRSIGTNSNKKNNSNTDDDSTQSDINNDGVVCDNSKLIYYEEMIKKLSSRVEKQQNQINELINMLKAGKRTSEKRKIGQSGENGEKRDDSEEEYASEDYGNFRNYHDYDDHRSYEGHKLGGVSDVAATSLLEKLFETKLASSRSSSPASEGYGGLRRRVEREEDKGGEECHYYLYRRGVNPPPGGANGDGGGDAPHKRWFVFSNSNEEAHWHSLVDQMVKGALVRHMRTVDSRIAEGVAARLRRVTVDHVTNSVQREFNRQRRKAFLYENHPLHKVAQGMVAGGDTIANLSLKGKETLCEPPTLGQAHFRSPSSVYSAKENNTETGLRKGVITSGINKTTNNSTFHLKTKNTLASFDANAINSKCFDKNQPCEHNNDDEIKNESSPFSPSFPPNSAVYKSQRIINDIQKLKLLLTKFNGSDNHKVKKEGNDFSLTTTEDEENEIFSVKDCNNVNNACVKTQQSENINQVSDCKVLQQNSPDCLRHQRLAYNYQNSEVQKLLKPHSKYESYVYNDNKVKKNGNIDDITPKATDKTKNYHRQNSSNGEKNAYEKCKQSVVEKFLKEEKKENTFTVDKLSNCFYDMLLSKKNNKKKRTAKDKERFTTDYVNKLAMNMLNKYQINKGDTEDSYSNGFFSSSSSNEKSRENSKNIKILINSQKKDLEEASDIHDVTERNGVVQKKLHRQMQQQKQKHKKEKQKTQIKHQHEGYMTSRSQTEQDEEKFYKKGEDVLRGKDKNKQEDEEENAQGEEDPLLPADTTDPTVRPRSAKRRHRGDENSPRSSISIGQPSTRQQQQYSSNFLPGKKSHWAKIS